MRDAEKRTGKAVARDACKTQAGLESGFYGRASHEHWRQPQAVIPTPQGECSGDAFFEA